MMTIISSNVLMTDLQIAGRIVFAFFLGALIGLEREQHGISAGIRTYGAIALGSCLYGILSLSLDGADPSRIAAQVATGIGFLGGGVIFRRDRNFVSGLTTAATLWATAAIGLAVSFGLYFVSVLTSFLIFVLLYLSRIPGWQKFKAKNKGRNERDKD